MTATALLTALLLCWYWLRAKRAATAHLRGLRAMSDAIKERAYENHDIYHTCKFLREYTDYPGGMQPPASYDR